MSMRDRRSLLTTAALLLLPLALSGCAVAVLPALAGGLVGRKAIEGPAPAPERMAPIVEVLAKPGVPAPDPVDLAVPAPAPAPSPVAEPAPGLAEAATVETALSAPAPAAASPAATPAPASPGTAAELPALAATLPATPAITATPPQAAFTLRTEDAPPPPGSYAAFGRFAAVRAAPPLAGKPRQSALIDADSLSATPRTGACGSQRPAVAIDLDPGDRTFNLDDPPLPATGLAEVLADLRLAGISVLWVSSLTTDSEGRLGTILRATGLDPERKDRVVLLRKGRKDRKTTRLREVGADYCIVAVAGDRRGDFEEAYDYLRDPDGPIARTLDANIGNGWFLTPLPIQ